MNEPDVSTLMSVPEAIRALDLAPVTSRVIRVPLAEADGLRLARALSADRDFPPFAKSQMDGYAVRRADVARLPADLKVVEEVAAGQAADRAIGAGEAMAIMTGAPLPEGAEGVVPVEDVERIDAQAVRILRVAGDVARFVARRGSDCPAGQLVLSIGATLGPAQIAVAASVGAAELDVFDRPNVAILATGDELTPIEGEPGPARIRNSNSPMLASLLRRLGCRVSDLGVAPDDPAAIRSALQRGLTYDALFVTGGMSMGARDYVPRLLRELGVGLRITGLRIKPGKPFAYGVKEADEGQAPGAPAAASCHVFGLPGNPVSAFVCTLRLGARVLTRMAGGAPDERWLTGQLATGLPANGPREFYLPAVRMVARGGDSSQSRFATITPLNWKGSADLFTLAQANVLIARPENDPPLPKGTMLRVLET